MDNENNILPELLSGEELERRSLGPDFLREDDWWDAPFEESMLDLDDEMEYPEYSLKVTGARTAPVTGLCFSCGQAGNGKTQTCTLLMAAYLGAEIEGIELIWKRRNIKVLYVDTEMEKGNTQLVISRIARLCNKSVHELKDKLDVMRLRDEDDHAMIWKKILKATYALRPDVLFLDGMIDIIGDFNDNKEAARLIRKLMKTADKYELCLWGVLHQNPGSEKTAGHQGSYWDRKAAFGIQTSLVWDDEDNGICHFEIKNKKQRGEVIRKLKFRMEPFSLPNGEKNAYPCVMGEISQPVVEKPGENVLLDKAMKDCDFRANGKSWTELEGNLKDAGYGRNQRHRMIKDATEIGIICKEDNGRYYYHGLGSKTPSTEPFPFNENDDKPPF